ncbi:MAG: CDP-alcohol phosphatidyltransferase family protein [Clostridia bacterium]|nr:CDP-alcohol phosphatidyltransferase family protein [Clostridia bacterium]
MIGFYNYTVILTYLGLASGVIGILNAFEGRITIAILCLIFSGFFDMFDGLVARTKKDRTKQEKTFGIELDSLSDVICFGVLPAAIGYAVGLNKWYFYIILVVYVLAALIRLAYFNVSEVERQEQTTEVRKEYLGLPVTSAALIIPLIYTFILCLKDYFYILYGITLLVVAFAFLAKFKIKKLKMKGMIAVLIIGLIELIILLCQR